MRHLTAVQLRDYLEQTHPKPSLIDVREPWEFDICHIEGSRLIPMNDLASALDELDKNIDNVLICHHGIRSQRVGHWLEASGFTRIINLSGGIHSWAQTVDTSLATY